MFFLIFPLLALCCVVVHLLVNQRSRRSTPIPEVILLYLLAINVGLEGIFGFYGHAFMADEVARSIGWQPSPFQFEVAIANLAFGVLGILCIWFRGQFWLATGIGVSVWLLGDAFGHIREMLVQHNYAPNNAGPALYSDIVLPLLILGFLTLNQALNQRKLRT